MSLHHEYSGINIQWSIIKHCLCRLCIAWGLLIHLLSLKDNETETWEPCWTKHPASQTPQFWWQFSFFFLVNFQYFLFLSQCHASIPHLPLFPVQMESLPSPTWPRPICFTPVVSAGCPRPSTSPHAPSTSLSSLSTSRPARWSSVPGRTTAPISTWSPLRTRWT